MGVVFFVYNAVFSTVLLIIVLVAVFFAFFSKNPDTRYQPMRDDRGSFIKSQTALNTELDALGATARGESKHGFTNSRGARIEDDDESSNGSDIARQKEAAHQQQTAYTGQGMGMTPAYNQPRAGTTGNGPYDSHSRTGSMTSGSFRSQGASPSPWQRGAGYD